MTSNEIEPFRADEMAGDVRQPWDRLDGEAVFEHDLLKGYLDLGTKRSLAELARRIGVPRERLQAYSIRHSWVARATSFDADVTRRALIELEGEGVEMRQRHADAAKLTLEKALAAVELVRPEFMQPRDIPVWLDVASKLERTSRGVQDTKRVELTGAGGGPIEVANGLSAEDRRALLAAVQEQIAARIGVPEIEAFIEGEVISEDDAGE